MTLFNGKSGPCIISLIRSTYPVCIRTSNKISLIPKDLDLVLMDPHRLTCIHPLQPLQDSVIYQTSQTLLCSNSKLSTVDSSFSTLPPSASSVSTGKRVTTYHSSQPPTNGNISELDKLFARLEPADNVSSSTGQFPKLTSNMSLSRL